MKAILGSVERDVADAFAYIPYGLAAAVVFLLIMILYNRKKYGRVSFIIKSSLMIIYVVVVGHLTLFSRESGIVDRVDLTVCLSVNIVPLPPNMSIKSLYK